MLPQRTNLKIEKNAFIDGHTSWVPAIQNGYMAAPCYSMIINYDEFKKTASEKMKLYSLKKQVPKSRNHKFVTFLKTST
jgi:hypothetical protein